MSKSVITTSKAITIINPPPTTPPIVKYIFFIDFSYSCLPSSPSLSVFVLVVVMVGDSGANDCVGIGWNDEDGEYDCVGTGIPVGTEDAVGPVVDVGASDAVGLGMDVGAGDAVGGKVADGVGVGIVLTVQLTALYSTYPVTEIVALIVLSGPLTLL